MAKNNDATQHLTSNNDSTFNQTRLNLTKRYCLLVLQDDLMLWLMPLNMHVNISLSQSDRISQRDARGHWQKQLLHTVFVPGKSQSLIIMSVSDDQ